MTSPPAATIKKVRTLFEITVDLRQGKDFNITRLTTLKSFCKDVDAAASFALHMSKLTQKAMMERGCPDHIDEDDWKRYRRLVGRAVRMMASHVKQDEQDKEAMRNLWAELRDEQSEYKRHQWGVLRIIKSGQLLLVETALDSFIRPEASHLLCYDIARQYAERYDSRYGTGLIPESAPFVQDIAEFWAAYFLGRGWRKQLAG